MIFMGRHRLPHIGVTILPTKTFLGLHLAWVGSTITVLPTDIGAEAGRLPHTRCSLCGCSVTHHCSFNVPILSGTVSPLHTSLCWKEERRNDGCLDQ